MLELRLSATFVLLLLAMGLNSSGAAERAIGVRPLAEVRPAQFGAQKEQSYGVFVGVDRFEDDSINALKYAAADAKAVRDCFVKELGYLPAANARLLVSGGEGAARPTRANILKAISQAARRAGPAGCIVVHLSTHGIEGYVLGEDSQRELLKQTAVALSDIQEIMAASSCPRRLLFFDACREKVAEDGAKAVGGAMSPAFAKAFADAQGFAVLMSCSAGQFSYEMADAGQGAFTHFLLEGLRGGAPANAEGLITVTGLAHWVKGRVEVWSKGRSGGVQSPLCTLQEASGDLPLAASRASLEAEEQTRNEALVRKLGAMLGEGKLTQAQFKLAQGALDSGAAKDRKVIEDLAAGRLAPEYLEALVGRRKTELIREETESSPAPKPGVKTRPAPEPTLERERKPSTEEFPQGQNAVDTPLGKIEAEQQRIRDVRRAICSRARSMIMRSLVRYDNVEVSEYSIVLDKNVYPFNTMTLIETGNVKPDDDPKNGLSIMAIYSSREIPNISFKPIKTEKGYRYVLTVFGSSAARESFNKTIEFIRSKSTDMEKAMEILDTFRGVSHSSREAMETLRLLIDKCTGAYNQRPIVSTDGLNWDGNDIPYNSIMDIGSGEFAWNDDKGKFKRNVFGCLFKYRGLPKKGQMAFFQDEQDCYAFANALEYLRDH